MDAIGRCEACRHWDQSHHRNRRWGRCTKACGQDHEASQRSASLAWAEAEKLGAYWLNTHNSFGCVQFKPQPKPIVQEFKIGTSLVFSLPNEFLNRMGILTDILADTDELLIKCREVWYRVHRQFVLGTVFSATFPEQSSVFVREYPHYDASNKPLNKPW